MPVQPHDCTTGSDSRPQRVAAPGVQADELPLSVLMPVYNAAPYLPEAIESILAQTFCAFEFVIVDDGSTDASPDILACYAAKDTRIRVIRQQNTGIVGALNRGLADCRGALVARMDADDVALPERLARQVEFLAVHSEVVAVGSWYAFIDQERRGGSTASPPTEHGGIEQILLLGNGGCLCHPTVMMRKAAVLQCGGYQKDYEWVEDVALFLALARVGFLANIPQVLLRYRRHSGSVNHTKLAVQKQTLFRLREAAYRDRGLRLPRGFYWNPPEKEPVAWYTERGWRMFNEGKRAAALRCALAGMMWSPLNGELWRIGACSILKRPRSAA